MGRGTIIGGKRCARGVLGLLALVVGLLLTSAVAVQAAPIHYAPPTIPSDTVTFPIVNESSPTDAVPLYGAPTTPATGNTLSFANMSGFAATSTNGTPAIDFIDGQLNVTVQAKPGHTITGIDFSESGDFSLGRLLNLTGQASAYPTTPGLLIKIKEVAGVPVTITLPAIPLVYTAAPPYTFTTPTDVVKTGTWSASASYLFTYANVTRFELSLNNQLYAASETGTSASLSKKALDLQVITSPTFVPEPSALSGLAVLLLAARRRSRCGC